MQSSAYRRHVDANWLRMSLMKEETPVQSLVEHHHSAGLEYIAPPCTIC